MVGETCEVCFSFIPPTEKVCLQGGHVVCACCEAKSKAGVGGMIVAACKAVYSVCCQIAFVF